MLKGFRDKKKCVCPGDISWLQQLLILCFAFSGNCAVLIAYSYPSGFYLEFLKRHKIQDTLGTVVISTCQVTTVLGPLVAGRFPALKKVPVGWRSLVLCVVGSASSSSLYWVDTLVQVDVQMTLVLIAVSRAVLGTVMGIFFVIVQGEILDRYYKEDKTMMVLIGSGVYAGNTLGGIIGTEAFTHGGWALTGPLVAALNLLPLLFLALADLPPPENTYETLPETLPLKENQEDRRVLRGLTTGQIIVFYLPDMAFFCNNVSFSVLTYVVPYRLLQFRHKDLGTSVCELNAICCFSIFLGLGFAYLTSKKLDVFAVMIASNVVFYMGCFLMYASTTDYFPFPYDFQLSALMVGFGDATITNLLIMSKFVMFEKWKVDLTSVDLAQHATQIFNVSDALGYIVGTVASGLTATKKSEKPTIVSIMVYMCLTTMGLGVCKATT